MENSKICDKKKFSFSLKIKFLFTAPFIYSLIFPIFFLHVFTEIYQRISFPIYKIEILKFKDFFSTERIRVCHLSWFEKLNCLYCDYANGCLAYVSEIAGRTERFWCPIKHKNKKRVITHIYYDDFFEPEDEIGFKKNKIERVK